MLAIKAAILSPHTVPHSRIYIYIYIYQRRANVNDKISVDQKDQVCERMRTHGLPRKYFGDYPFLLLCVRFLSFLLVLFFLSSVLLYLFVCMYSPTADDEPPPST